MSEITRGVIGMPYEMAMESELSRRQFYNIAQGLLAQNETLTKIFADAPNLPDTDVEWLEKIRALEAKNEVLRIANAFLLPDAQRHRWLRANGYDMGSFHREHEHNAKAWFESLDDSTIDAAIAEEAKP